MRGVAGLIEAHVHVGGPDDCWPTDHGVNRSGYARWKRNGESEQAHRAVYEHMAGPIPEGLTIDHLCKTRNCCNPNHMEPVPLAVNVLRGDGPPARNARKQRCKRGHAFAGDNLLVDTNGHRRCRVCQYAKHAARRARERGEQAAAVEDFVAEYEKAYAVNPAQEAAA